MALSTANDNNPWNSKNAYNNREEAVKAGMAYAKANGGISMDVYQTSGGHWHYQPQYQTNGQGVSQDTYNTLYPSKASGDGGSNVSTPSSNGGVTTPSTNTSESFLQSIKDTLTSQMDKMNARISEFDKNNPFSFDAAMAEASAKERYDPFYSAELSDFLKGIDTQTSTLEGSRTLLTELNRINAGADAIKLQTAIDKTQQGYSDVGLFFSGANTRDVGLANIGGIQTTQTRKANFNQGIGNINNQENQLTTDVGTYNRRSTAQEATDVATEVAKQKAEAAAAYATEKAQYVGYPYMNPSSGGAGITGGLNQLLGYTFQ